MYIENGSTANFMNTTRNKNSNTTIIAVTLIPPYHQWTGHPDQKKINKETSVLDDTTDQVDIFHMTATECIFFSAVHGTFSKIDHILGHKPSTTNIRRLK
jgi:hypothetical protein